MDNQTQAAGFFPTGTARDFLIITILFCVALFLVNPMGDFPLNDDWSYGIAVKRFLEEGSYYPTVWTSMSLISQVLWGAAVASVFGFSFEVLRFSTLILSLLAIFGIYLIVRYLKQPSWLALLISLTVAFNPIYFALSNTFMTDVPFMAFSVMAILFFVRNLQNNHRGNLLAGTAFTIIAVLCRQNALFIPLAFAISLLYKNGINKASVLKAFIPLALSLTALFAFQYWLERTGKMPSLYGKQIGDLLQVVSSPALWPQSLGLNGAISILYIGLFLLPVLVVLSFTNRAVIPWLSKVIFPLAIISTLIMAYAGRLMPVRNSILNSSGIGPLTLHDTYLLGMPHVPELPDIYWMVISLVSVIGAGLLIWFFLPLFIALSLNIYKAVRRKRWPEGDHSITLFFLAGALIYFAPLAFLGFYDRYLLMLMVLLAFTLISFMGRLNLPVLKVMPVAGFIILPMALFTIAATHDYFSWNRARWDALRSFSETNNVPPSKINGGFEYNGYSLFYNKEFTDVTDDQWWEEEDDLYMLAFGNLPDYEVVDYYPYKSWLPPYTGKILILKEERESERELTLDTSGKPQ